MKRPRVDVNLEELDQIIDRGTRAPLSESEGQKLKTCHGRETTAETEYGENQCRSAAGCGAGRQAGDRRIGSGRSWGQ